MKLDCTVNGQPVSLEVDDMRRLLDILRDDLRLSGTKEGCGEGECGACSVFVNGRLVNSCLVPAAQCVDAEIVTIEGVAASERGAAITDSFARMHSAQCGFCTPGMVMAAEALLREESAPDETRIREGLAGNICRCTGYDMIVDGIQDAATRISSTESNHG